MSVDVVNIESVRWEPPLAVGARLTEMTLRNRGEPAGFARVTGPMMARAMGRANRADLARLKAILETD